MKNKNPADLTSRNNNACKKEIAELRMQVLVLANDVATLRDYLMAGCTPWWTPPKMRIDIDTDSTIKTEKSNMKKKGTKKGGKKGSC
ncbi:MAG TPA: hypothetical protein PLJ74_05310 [Myxococcota bacterium]|nr:hypothetical protein [Myxococcota bacterium]